MTAERQFIDTNVIVYAFDPSAGQRHEQAVELIDALWQEGRGALSVQVLQEFFATVTRKIAEPADVSSARRGVRALARMTTHEPDAEDVIGAIDIHRDSGISIWDAMIVRSASQLGCEVLWTEDLNDGQVYRGVRVKNPFA